MLKGVSEIFDMVMADITFSEEPSFLSFSVSIPLD